MATKIKFTDSAVQKLTPPASGRVEYADTRITGLTLRVTANGVKSFCLLRRLKTGTLERVTLGRFPDIKCEAAIRKASELIGVIASGANPAEMRRALKAEPTFAEFFTEYLERHSRLWKRTTSGDESMYARYLAKPLGKKKLSTITRADLSAIHGSITKAGHPTGANRVKDLFSSVFSKAVAWNYLDANPAKGIEDNPEVSRDRFLVPGELPRLFEALEGEPNTNFRDFFLMSLLTGARRSNVAAMRWQDINMTDREWVIPKEQFKNGEPMHVPLVPEAVAILEARKASAAKGATYVFPASRSDSEHGHMSGERKAWLRILDRDEVKQLRERINDAGGSAPAVKGETVSNEVERLRAIAKRLNVNTEGARLRDLRIHDLRRTMGSWQARTGASLIIIGKSLGHRSPQSTAVYARLDLDPVREAMETASTAMIKAGRKQPPAQVVKLKKRAAV